MIEKQQILETAIKIAKKRDWQAVSMREIAEVCDMKLSDLEKFFSNKNDIVKAILNQIDYRLDLEQFDFDHEFDTDKDRIFEVIMYRFDLLNENREAIISMLGPAISSPELALEYKDNFCHSMRLVLEKAEITPSTAVVEDAMIVSLSITYMLTVKVWLKDDSEDMNRTMAALDNHLTKMFKFFTIFDKLPLAKTLWS